MPKKLIKRYMPDAKKIKQHKSLQFFGKLLHSENLWHLNRTSVSRAFAIGLFCAFLPMPFQMVIAAALAILFRANLPISVCLVWVTNPITMPPMFYFAYKVGTYVLHMPPQHFEMVLSFKWLTTKLLHIWEPLVLGSLICGAVSGVIGYWGIQLLWRLHVIRAWRLRKRHREHQAKIHDKKP